MKDLRKILFPFGWLYGLVMFLRNTFFDWGLLKSRQVSIPVISVGNLSVGGTGKTPHIEWLVRELKAVTPLAILMRGYGRNTKGFLLVGKNATTETVGDEALQYKRKFREDVIVAVCEDRVKGAKQLIEQFPHLGCILLDDAFQHRWIYRDTDVLLMDSNQPFWKELVLPAGNLREFASGRKRASVHIVTKCSADLFESEAQQRKIIKRIGQNENQLFGFSRIKYGEIIGFHGAPFHLPNKVLLVTGIAQVQPFVEHVSRFAVVEQFNFPDHHAYTASDIQKIHDLFDTFADANSIILTTEKDFMRLSNPKLFALTQRYPWYYQGITVEVKGGEQIIKKIKTDVRANS